MGDKTFMIPPIGSKSILRSTGEEVEIIDFEAKERGDRTDEDWVTYIDSNGKEHIKEHLNIQLDFKSVVNDTYEDAQVFIKKQGLKEPKRDSGVNYEV